MKLKVKNRINFVSIWIDWYQFQSVYVLAIECYPSVYVPNQLYQYTNWLISISVSLCTGFWMISVSLCTDQIDICQFMYWLILQIDCDIYTRVSCMVSYECCFPFLAIKDPSKHYKVGRCSKICLFVYVFCIENVQGSRNLNGQKRDELF